MTKWYLIELRKSITNGYGCYLKDTIQLSSKFEMNLHAITFIKHRITSKDIEVDHAIQNMPTLENVASLCRLLDMGFYVGKFITNLTSIISPTSRPHKKDTTKMDSILVYIVIFWLKPGNKGLWIFCYKTFNNVKAVTFIN